MFRLSLTFIPGMIVAILTGTPMVAWLATFFVSIAIGTALLIYHHRSYRALIVMTLSFSLGGTLVASSSILTSNNIPGIYASDPKALQTSTSDQISRHDSHAVAVDTRPHIGLVEEITPNANGHRATMTLLPRWPETHRVVVYFSNCGSEISIGDTISFYKQPLVIPPPKNDFEFNAQRYYLSMGIVYRTFLKDGEFKHHPFYGFSLQRSSDRLRHAISHKIRERVSNSGAAGIMIAMLIGDKSNIDSNLKSSYSKSGAIHILAISGLHIGIVASILIGLFGLPRPQRTPSLAIFKACTVISGIWLFTWISGMSPSATRAAFMFTIYIIGLLIMRKAHILNILGFTAIVLLIREPNLLLNLGFQFSFLALTGIVIWGMPLLRSISFKYKIFQHAWSIIAISIGAQILVAPAILYYFNEISVLSPITSLIAIPAAYLIVFGSIVMLVAELFSPVLGGLIGSIMSFGIEKLNQLFTFFSELPVSTMDKIYLSSGEVAILGIILLLASIRILSDRPIWLKPVLPLSLIFCVVHFYQYSVRTTLPHLTIYSDKTEFAIDIFTQDRTQTSINSDRANFYTIQAANRNRTQHYSRVVEQLSTTSHNSQLPFIKIKINTSALKTYQIIYIAHDPGSIDFSSYKNTIVILAKSLNYFTVRRLKSELYPANLIVHDMRSQGPFNLLLS